MKKNYQITQTLTLAQHTRTQQNARRLIAQRKNLLFVQQPSKE